LEKFKADLLHMPVCADCRRGAPRTFIGTQSKGRRPTAGVGFLGRGRKLE